MRITPAYLQRTSVSRPTCAARRRDCHIIQCDAWVLNAWLFHIMLRVQAGEVRSAKLNEAATRAGDKVKKARSSGALSRALAEAEAAQRGNALERRLMEAEQRRNNRTASGTAAARRLHLQSSSSPEPDEVGLPACMNNEFASSN